MSEAFIAAVNNMTKQLKDNRQKEDENLQNDVEKLLKSKETEEDVRSYLEKKSIYNNAVV